MGTPASRRLRVLTLVDGIGVSGGGETLARLIAMGLDSSRFEPALCVTRWEPRPEYESVLEELRDAGVAFLGLPRRSRAQLGPWRELVRYARDWRADVLHSHKIGSNFWGALVAPRIGVPVWVAHEHGWAYRGSPHRRWLDRYLIARRADAFVAVSRADRRRMVELEHIPESKTRFIPNGIPDPPPRDRSRDVRAELGIAPDAPVVGIVAVARPEKALDLLIRAAARLRREFPGLRVLMIGVMADPDRAVEVARRGAEQIEIHVQRRLHDLTAELGLSGAVEFLGNRRDVPDLLEAVDVAVLCSEREGSPLSLLEYMEAGKPVVATRVGGVPDMIEDGVSGLLVEPRDPDHLAAAIATLLRDPDRAAAMGRAAQERRRQEFSIEAMVGRVEALYEELWASKSPRA
jgi:glycosyltransferase involved in cell wall biosynthesis